jgi:mRNA deadenylase 3'-5' endonuclease subunit Ccr4
VPEISRFYGIIIYIFYREHQPPHFHAVYGEYEALVAIDTLALLRGHLPPRAAGLVAEWATIHQEELKKVWQQAVDHQQLDKIEPLK